MASAGSLGALVRASTVFRASMAPARRRASMRMVSNVGGTAPAARQGSGQSVAKAADLGGSSMPPMISSSVFGAMLARPLSAGRGVAFAGGGSGAGVLWGAGG